MTEPQGPEPDAKATPGAGTKSSGSHAWRDQMRVIGAPDGSGLQHEIFTEGSMRRVKPESLIKLMPMLEKLTDRVWINEGMITMPLSSKTREICASLLADGLALQYADIDANNVYFDAYVSKGLLTEQNEPEPEPVDAEAEMPQKQAAVDQEQNEAIKGIHTDLDTAAEQSMDVPEFMYVLRALAQNIERGQGGEDLSPSEPLTVGNLKAAILAVASRVEPHALEAPKAAVGALRGKRAV